MFERKNGVTIFQDFNGHVHVVYGPFPEPLKIVFQETEAAKKAKENKSHNSISPHFVSYLRDFVGLFKKKVRP